MAALSKMQWGVFKEEGEGSAAPRATEQCREWYKAREGSPVHVTKTDFFGGSSGK